MNGPEPHLDLDEARIAARKIATARREVETLLQDQIELAADAEAEYRKKYATTFLGADGSMQLREQRAKLATADLAQNRDIKQGMVKVFQERLKGLEGERAMLRLFADWSQKF